MLPTLTIVHVAISLIGIGAGFVVMWGLMVSQRLDKWTAIFLSATIATSVTGFFFPIERLTPGLVLGILSLIVLTPAVVARYYYQLVGPWWSIYSITAMIAQYLNVLVLIVQAFQKIPALRELAPTQSELPFALTQFVTLVLFIGFTTVVVVRHRAAPPTEQAMRAEATIPRAQEAANVQGSL